MKRNPTSFWLRVLGKGKTQERAILELEALPQGHPLRQSLAELLASWHVTIEVKDDLTQNDRELLMKRSPLYLRWREDSLEQGRQAGIQEGRQEGRQENRQLVINNWGFWRGNKKLVSSGVARGCSGWVISR